METNNNSHNTIPVGGTLGILAYGYRGIMAWRQVRHEFSQSQKDQIKKTQSHHEKN